MTLPRLLLRCLPFVLGSAIALAQTWHQVPSTVPTTAVTWDAARHRLLLAGTDSEQRMFEWDGTTARERLGELTGQKTVQHLFYDRAESAVMALSTDRWVGTWTGGAWTWRNGGSPPPNDLESSIAFDAARRRLVVITGTAVHEWDGQRWWHIGTFGIYAGTAFAYDPVSQRCIAYGGSSALVARTEAWDGFTWTQIAGAGQPGARSRASLAIDPSTQLLALYGGNALPWATDTWLWNGSSWQQLPTTNDPGPQTRAHFVTDDQGVLLLPLEGPDTGEIWRLGNSTWAQQGALTSPPEWRTNTGWAYDFARGTIVGFGGDQFGLTVPPEQTVLFDRRWLPVQVATNPPLRHSAHLAWSSFDQKVLMFGGIYQGSIYRGDTWTWNGTDWEPRAPTQSPSPRHHAVMVQDPAGGVMLFGGSDGTSYFGDHWHWDGTDWQPQNPPGLPPARRSAAGCYDPVRGQVVMFGGYSTNNYTTETWLWNGTNWTQAAANAPTSINTMTFRPATGRVLLAGQTNAYEWTGTTWLPMPGLGHGQPFTPRFATHFGRGQVLLFQTPIVRRLFDIPARTESYGTSCAIGPSPALAAVDYPAPDTTFTIELTARIASAPTLLTIGFAAQSVQLGSGCRALVGQQLGAYFAPGNTGGIARFLFPLPNDPTLRGEQFTAQGAVWNPASSPLGSATLTAGMKVTIGD